MNSLDNISNTNIKKFLEAWDLDELASARKEIKSVNQEETKIIRTIIEEWKDKQAIANLLTYNSLIPKDIRFKTIINGLNEKSTSYFVLSTVVGSQRIRKNEFTKKNFLKSKKDYLIFLKRNLE